VYFLGAKVTHKFFKFSLKEILHFDTKSQPNYGKQNKEHKKLEKILFTHFIIYKGHLKNP
jgi:hypothetical protein